MKTKETYAIARSLLEKYGETITPQVQSPVMNGNNKGTDVHQRASIKPMENGHSQVQTPVRGGPTRLAGRRLSSNN